MSDVRFFLQSIASSGFTVGDVWEAYVKTAFKKWSFTAFYGKESEAVLLTLPPGNYWVQLKMPHGELTKDLVTIPDQREPYDVVLHISEVPQSATRSLSAFSKRGQTVLQTIDTVPHRLPSAPLSLSWQTRSIGLPLSSPPLPTFSLFRFSEFEIGSGEPIREDVASLSQFSLTRFRGKFIWPKHAGSIRREPSDGFVQPEDYFRPLLSRLARYSPMSVVVDGNSLTSEIVEIGEAGADRSRKDIADGRFTRDLIVLKRRRGKILMVSTIPNGWQGDNVRLRITASDSDNGSVIRLSVEVKDPKFNALLQFMKGGDLDSAIRVIENCIEILHAKFRNPFAAAAAGYVLIQAAPQTLQVPWQVWIGNLAHYLKDFPDGEILHATLLLQRGDAAERLDSYTDDHVSHFPTDEVDRYLLAAQLIVSALGKGPPMFRSGLSLLSSNLSILSSVVLPDDVRLLLNEGKKLVTWLSMRVDPIEPFSVFHLRR